MKLSQSYKYRRMVSHCPCGKPNKNRKGVYRFNPMLDEQGSIVPNSGFCHSCNKHFSPEVDSRDFRQHARSMKFEPPKLTYAPQEVVESTRTRPAPLIACFDELGLDVRHLSRYLTGEYHGKNAFWLLDGAAKIVTAQIQGFDADFHNTGSTYLHAVHNPPWPKSDIIPAFGEHLLVRGGQAVVVEAVKTALLMTCIYPDRIWVATLGSGRLKALLRRNPHVHFTLFPDNDLPGRNWVDLAKQEGHSVFTEYWKHCADGEDIADVVLRDIL